MRIPVAKEGYPFIFGASVPAAALWIAYGVWGGATLRVLAIVVTVLALVVLAFFRDPERHGPRGDHLVIAPADGKVIDIREVEEDTYLHTSCKRVSIFLSLADVHVNRYPVSGEVEHRRYDTGRFEPAWRSTASHGNERASTGIRALLAPILVRQIAGLAAKRIVTYASVGDRVRQGERMGLIRFGSRVDLFLPLDSEILVDVGQRAVGGLTVIAQLEPGAKRSE